MSDSELVEPSCTTGEAARRLEISVKTAQLWVEEGILHAWKTPGGHRRISVRSIESVLAGRHKGVPVTRVLSELNRPRGHLLVVEDDPLLHRLYEVTVPSWQLPVDLALATDGFQALLRIGERRPDMLITDLRMPGMDGFRLIQALRAEHRYRSIQIVTVSMLSASDIRAAGGLPEGVTVLAKPVPFEHLREVVAHQFRAAVGSTGARA
jgi:excisionase family DNA binding protein